MHDNLISSHTSPKKRPTTWNPSWKMSAPVKFHPTLSKMNKKNRSKTKEGNWKRHTIQTEWGKSTYMYRRKSKVSDAERGYSFAAALMPLEVVEVRRDWWCSQSDKLNRSFTHQINRKREPLFNHYTLSQHPYDYKQSARSDNRVETGGSTMKKHTDVKGHDVDLQASSGSAWVLCELTAWRSLTPELLGAAWLQR